MKKQVGRPGIGTANAKGIVFAARFTPSETKQLNAAVRQARQGKSEWIRKALLSSAQSDKTVA
jgi:hypothetical protein